MGNFKIKKCIPEDWKLLQQISIETFSATYRDKNDPEDFNQHLETAFSELQLKKELMDTNCEFYFFKNIENEIAGYLKLNELTAQTEPMSVDDFEVERIYVLKKFQGMGLGKVMIDFAKKRAFQKQKKKVWLGVWEKNPNAIGFYTKMGFKKIGTHIFKVGDDEQLDFVMSMDLK